MEDALLAAICAQPEDIAARLAYADYLLDQPEAARRDRGEFILAQCRRAAGGLPPNEDWAFQGREKELLAKYRDEWLAPLTGLVNSAAFHRGFPERITMGPAEFAGGFAEVVKITPVARLHLALGDHIAGMPELSGVVGLDLSREHVTADALRGLLESPHLTRLNYLNVSDNPLGDTGADVLAESPMLKRLHFLSVARCGLTSSGVSRLVSRVTTDAPQLRWLNLRGNLLSPGNWAENVLHWLTTKMPVPLRLSLEGQLGRYRVAKPPPDPGPLPRLKAIAAKLPSEFAALVKAIDTNKPAQLAAAVGAHPLPPEVHRAFAAVCVRRFAWVHRRLDKGKALPTLPEPTGPKGLAELVREVLCTTLKSPADDAVWLRDWLLRLYEQHVAGMLDPEGRTR